MPILNQAPAAGGRRLIVWPDICPEGLSPPGPCFYLTWPAWEAFRRSDLGQEVAAAGLSPLELADPPAFAASLRTLLGAASSHEGHGALSYLAAPPWQPLPPESPLSLARSIRGDPAPPRGQLAGTAFLSLALWACARLLAREADGLLAKAMDRRRELMSGLRGQDDDDQTPVAAWGPPGPPAATGVFSAWLKLAGPILGPEDRLWTPDPGHREEAALALAKAGSPAHVWPPPDGSA
ncbi:MAG: hypothetical protein LBP92_11930 [Deltaproteobacteria bacterium]|jgi:hypothetical protein|nr:hypothetical protein [Deltaproteobacteria bacterium]